MQTTSRYRQTDLPEVTVQPALQGVKWICLHDHGLPADTHVKARLKRSQLSTGYLRYEGALAIFEPVVRWDHDDDRAVLS
jgi:hypothetical protein